MDRAVLRLRVTGAKAHQAVSRQPVHGCCGPGQQRRLVNSLLSTNGPTRRGRGLWPHHQRDERINRADVVGIQLP
jgi:hypothetical protein